MTNASASEYISRTILDEANAEAKRIVREAEKAAKQLSDEALVRAKTNLVGWSERQRQMAQGTGDRVVGKARNDAHMRILDAKARLIRDSFDQAQKRFDKERASAQYKTFLKKLIINAGTQIDDTDIVVLVRKEDQAIVSKITGLDTAIRQTTGKSTKVAIGKMPMNILGGVLVQNKEGNITVDYRLETLLKQVEAQQRTMIATTLFAEEKKSENPS